jgi:hypothetical protein
MGKSVNMLDTTLSIDGNTIQSTLYCKPTDTHSYLTYTSSHPNACKNNIPFSQFLRIKRICSADEEFEKNSKFLSNCFINRGYPKKLIKRKLNQVRSLDRTSVLFNEPKDDKTKRIVFPITYHKNNVEICKL